MIIVQIVGWFLVFFLGFLVVDCLITKDEFIGKVIAGYFIGIGLFTLFLFLLNLAGFPFTLMNSLLGLIGLVVVTLVINLSRKGWRLKFVINIKNEFSGGGLLVKLILFLIFILFTSSLAYTLYWPIKDWDALTLYDMRGRIFAETGIMNEAFKIDRYYLAYPLYTSIEHAWVYILGMKNPLFLYSLNYIFFVIAFYFLIKRIVNKYIALGVAFIIASSLEIFTHSQTAYTNLPYAIYYSLGIIYFYYYLSRKEVGCLILSALFVGLSTWIRSGEPFWITPIILLFILLLRKKVKLMHLVIYGVVILSLKIPWSRFYSLNEPQNISSYLNLELLTNINFLVFFNRLEEVTRYLFTNFVSKLNILFIISILSTYIAWSKKKESFLLGLINLINYIIVFGGTLFYSFIYPKWWLVGDSVSRMSLVFIPIIIFLTVVSLSEVLHLKEKQ